MGIIGILPYPKIKSKRKRGNRRAPLSFTHGSTKAACFRYFLLHFRPPKSERSMILGTTEKPEDQAKERHQRSGAAPDLASSPAVCAPRPIHVAIPAPRSHVAKCSIFVARGPGGLLPFATNSSLTRRWHPRTRSRTHPQHARTHRHRK